jgi:hypothetical protein
LYFSFHKDVTMERAAREWLQDSLKRTNRFASLFFGVVTGSLFFAFALNGFAHDECEVRIRSLKTEPGLYVTPRSNTSSGFKVADLNAESIQSFLHSDPDLEGKVLYLVGTPVYGKDRQTVIHAAKQALLAQSTQTPIRLISRPNGLFERFRFLWLMPEDFQTPTREEIRTGFSKLAISGTTPFIVLLATQSWVIALPVGLINLAQSALATFYRRTLGNWQSRSYHFTEKFFKQMIVSLVFTAGIYFAAHWQELGQVLTLEGQWEMLKTVYAAVLFGTVWRALFHNGVYAWENTMTQRGKDVDGRRTAARLEMLASLFTTPFWIHSTITQESLFNVLGLMDYNLGHLGMSLTGAIGAYFWARPQVLDPSVKLLDALFNGITGIWVVRKGDPKK